MFEYLLIPGAALLFVGVDALIFWFVSKFD